MKRLSDLQIETTIAGESRQDLRDMAAALRDAYEREDRIREALDSLNTPTNQLENGNLTKQKILVIIRTILDEETK